MIVFFNLLFWLSYFFYISYFLNYTGKIIYPLYIYPLAVYSSLFFSALYLNRIWQVDFKYIIKKFLKVFLIFLGFFIAPVIIKFKFPEPHNFLQRKLELLGGVLYIIFIFGIFLLLVNELRKKYEEKIKNKKFIFINIIILFFAFYFYLTLWLNYANQPTGDEPIYLLVSHSIINDRDLDLKNNYENKDYKKFYLNRELKSQEELEMDGKLYSFHPVFYSILITPFYFIGGRLGVTVFSNILASFFLGFLFLLLFEIFKDDKNAFWMTIFTGLSMPLIMYVNQICTEVLNGLLILVSFYLINFKKDKILSICLFTALIPWAHYRNFIIWIFLILIFIFENWREIFKILKFIFFQIISVFSFFVFNFIHYKFFVPHRTKTISFFEVFKFRIEGILGLLLDQEFGLLFYTPLFIFIFAGAYFLFKKNKKIFYYLFLILMPYYFFISSWMWWNGGGGASNRFLVPVIFIFVIFVFSIVAWAKDKIIQKFIYTMLAFSLVISFIIISIPWFRWNKGMGINWILKIIQDVGKINISGLFPSLWYQPQNNIFQVISWIFLIFILNLFLIIRNFKNERKI